MEVRRGLLARLGVTLLNLLAPGLGLLRLGQWRRAAGLYAASLGAAAVFVAGLSLSDEISFAAYAAIGGLLFVASVVVYLLAIWLTWKNSQRLIQPRPVWSRWYCVVAAMLGAFAISWIMSDLSRARYRNFYLPSEAMEPTLYASDKLVARMGEPKDLRRGDLVLVRTSAGSIYIKRLAALPGDRIGLKQGTVVINGEAVTLEPVARRAVSYPYLPRTTATIFRERFPGEGSAHLVQDLGPSEVDDYPEVLVKPGHVFVLGDNRDNSADSRVPETMGGVEQVSLSDVIGRPLFLYWPFSKMGHTLRASSGK